MSSKSYSHIFFIGRYQPLHNGHVSVIKKAQELSDKVHIFIGSANASRSIRNPFTYQERASIFRQQFGKEIDQIRPISDYPYNDTKWITEVLTNIANIVGNTPNDKIAIIGHNKDNTTYYLSLFPQFQYIEVEQESSLNATQIRDLYFGVEDILTDYFCKIPKATQDFLLQFLESKEYLNLLEEYIYIQKYKDSWKDVPFPPTFVTVDSVVVQSGHILLVERGGNPGKGLLALPGGFLDLNEKMMDAAVRELREETCLKVPAPVLYGSCQGSQVFDHPLRSARGRTITQAFYFKLKDMPEGLPKVKGSDDARHAAWYPLSEIKPTQMFEDHFAIIQHFTHI